MLQSSSFRCMTTDIEFFVDTTDAPLANGVLEAGESGIEGVVVMLGSGVCPSTGLATAIARDYPHPRWLDAPE